MAGTAGIGTLQMVPLGKSGIPGAGHVRSPTGVCDISAILFGGGEDTPTKDIPELRKFTGSGPSAPCHSLMPGGSCFRNLFPADGEGFPVTAMKPETGVGSAFGDPPETPSATPTEALDEPPDFLYPALPFGMLDSLGVRGLVAEGSFDDVAAVVAAVAGSRDLPQAGTDPGLDTVGLDRGDLISSFRGAGVGSRAPVSSSTHSGIGAMPKLVDMYPFRRASDKAKWTGADASGAFHGEDLFLFRVQVLSVDR